MLSKGYTVKVDEGTFSEAYVFPQKLPLLDRGFDADTMLEVWEGNESTKYSCRDVPMSNSNVWALLIEMKDWVKAGLTERIKAVDAGIDMRHKRGSVKLDDILNSVSATLTILGDYDNRVKVSFECYTPFEDNLDLLVHLSVIIPNEVFFGDKEAIRSYAKTFYEKRTTHLPDDYKLVYKRALQALPLVQAVVSSSLEDVHNADIDYVQVSLTRAAVAEGGKNKVYQGISAFEEESEMRGMIYIIGRKG